MGNYFRDRDDEPSEHARSGRLGAPTLSQVLVTPFDVRSLTNEEHEIYDDLCKRSNKYGITKINVIFVELIRLRLKLGSYQRGVV